jgi:Ca2+-binding RTX toxin-like protein
MTTYNGGLNSTGNMTGGDRTVVVDLVANGSAPKLDPATVANFLASLPTELRSLTPTAVHIVAPGATIGLDVMAREGLAILGSATLDLSSSHKADGSPVQLGVVATGGDKVLLNHGPSYAVSLNGHDTIVSSGGHDFLRSALGSDSLVGGGQSHLVGGIDGNDTLVGGLTGAAQDTIASRGSSHIQVSFGSNLITAGAGDTIQAGHSSSTIYAADGAATITGGSGTLVYGSGASSILAGGGQNNTFNLTGSDTLTAQRGSAVVNVDGGSQASIHGGAGHLDVNLAGNTGNDTLFGGSGGLTIHVSANVGAIVNDPNTLDAQGYHVVQFASGETLHVSNVTIDFGNGQHKTV